MTALERLAAAIEAGTIARHDLDAFIPAFRGLSDDGGTLLTLCCNALDAYNDNMNAARALHEANLPGVPWEIWMVTLFDTNPKEYGCNLPGIETAYSFMPARSWLLAQVRALIAKEGKE